MYTTNATHSLIFPQQGGCTSACRSAAEDVVLDMKFVVDSLVALKPKCAFKGSSKILESYFIADDLFNTLGKEYGGLALGPGGFPSPLKYQSRGTSFIETINAMRIKCPTANIANDIASSNWCLDDDVSSASGVLLENYYFGVTSYFRLYACSGGNNTCTDDCVRAERYFVKAIGAMYESGSVLSTTPKLPCQLKGRVQKSSPAALIGAGEDYFWNLSLSVGNAFGLRYYGEGMVAKGFREELDGFNCPYDVCGNGRKEANEGCDDGNTKSGDGCSSTCTKESGFTCIGGSTIAKDKCCGEKGCTDSDGQVAGGSRTGPIGLAPALVAVSLLLLGLI
jgi:cysteine-rich repeat protein